MRASCAMFRSTALPFSGPAIASTAETRSLVRSAFILFGVNDRIGDLECGDRHGRFTCDAASTSASSATTAAACRAGDPL